MTREKLTMIEPGIWATKDGKLRAMQQPMDGSRLQGLWQWFYWDDTHDTLWGHTNTEPNGWSALYVDEFYDTLREAREALPHMRRELATIS